MDEEAIEWIGERPSETTLTWSSFYTVNARELYQEIRRAMNEKCTSKDHATQRNLNVVLYKTLFIPRFFWTCVYILFFVEEHPPNNSIHHVDVPSAVVLGGRAFR